MKLEVATP